MAKMSKVKHELELRNWQQLIAARNESGLSVREWCHNNNISRDAYYYWLRLIREKSISQLPDTVKNSLSVNEQEVPISFKKLEVESPLTGFQPAMVVHLNGATVEVPNGADRETVEAVLFALKSIC